MTKKKVMLPADDVANVKYQYEKIEASTPLLITYDPELIKKQVATSTRRFEEGNLLAVLDGIFIAIKDDIACYEAILLHQKVEQLFSMRFVPLKKMQPLLLDYVVVVWEQQEIIQTIGASSVWGYFAAACSLHDYLKT